MLGFNPVLNLMSLVREYMHKLGYIFWVIISLYAASNAVASDYNSVVIGTSPSLGPYVNKGRNSGVQLELIKAALMNQGFDNIKVLYMPNARVEKQLKAGAIDIALNYSKKIKNSIYPSQSILYYHNVIVSLKQKNFSINTIEDLKNKSVLAFQNAKDFLPDEFRLHSVLFSSYEEVANQKAQIVNLMKGRVDTIIIDRNIFYHYLKEYEQAHASSAVNIHVIFPPSGRPAFFNNQALKDMFDIGQKNIIKNGQYQSIMQQEKKIYSFSPII
jgi:polar amino acid transport system substrate-binding protein